MKIFFICSSLEPGHDGVGDYTRLLAGECVRHGHDCAIVALNDRASPEANESELTVASVRIRQLRLPATMPWSERVERVTAFRARFQPNWISVQFVPYGYNSKGLVWDLPTRLFPVVDRCKTHMMFHELWIGGGYGSSLKDRIIGQIQRALILRLHRLLRPSAVHTSLEVYRSQLEVGGVSSVLLPLFGSIPVIPLGPESSLREILRTCQAGRDLPQGPLLSAVHFGSIYPGWPSESVIKALSQVGEALHREVTLISVGRIGQRDMVRWGRLKESFQGNIRFIQLGERDPGFISRLFQSVDLGAPSAPGFLLGKSSSAAAMLEHGLPILVQTGVDTDPTRCDAPAAWRGQIVSTEAPLADQIAQIQSVRRPAPRLNEIARLFLEALLITN